MSTRDDDLLQPTPADSGKNAEADFDLPEDPLLNESLADLKQIPVPSNFLPNVMFRVYEKRMRDAISIAQAAMFAVGLLVLTLVFFAWDVTAYKNANQIASFKAAFEEKASQSISNIEEVVSLFGDMIVASWQLLGGIAGIYIFGIPLVVFVFLMLALAVVVIMVRQRGAR